MKLIGKEFRPRGLAKRKELRCCCSQACGVELPPPPSRLAGKGQQNIAVPVKPARRRFEVFATSQHERFSVFFLRARNLRKRVYPNNLGRSCLILFETPSKRLVSLKRCGLLVRVGETFVSA